MLQCFYLWSRLPSVTWQVMVDVDDKNEWNECIDIGGVRLPTGYFFGASAATGDLSGRSELPVKEKSVKSGKIVFLNLEMFSPTLHR